MSKKKDRGYVDDSEVLNVSQWQAIQRFGGGKVAVQKARKVAMQKLKQATGKDVGYEYMFTGDNVAAPPTPEQSMPPSGSNETMDPLFVDDGGLHVLNQRGPTRGSRTPSRSPQPSRSRLRSPSPMPNRRRSMSPYSDRPRGLSDTGSEEVGSPGFRSPGLRSPESSFRSRLRPQEPQSEVSTTPSSPPHGRSLIPKTLSYKSAPAPEVPDEVPQPDDAQGSSPPLETPPPLSLIAEEKQSQEVPPAASDYDYQAVPELQKGSSPVKRPASARPAVGSSNNGPRSSSPPWRGSGVAPERPRSHQGHGARPQTASPGRKHQGGTQEYWAARNESVRQSAARADEFYKKWKSGQSIPGSAPHKKAQPHSRGPVRPVEVRMFCFDEAHPALAEQHFKRSKEQNDALEKEKKDEAKKQKQLQLRMERESTIASVSRHTSCAPSMFGGVQRKGRGGPTPEELQRKLQRLQKDAGLGADAEDESEDLNSRSRAAQMRAKAAISASYRSSSAIQGGSWSRPPPRVSSMSPYRTRSMSRSRSPSPEPPSRAGSSWQELTLAKKAGASSNEIAAMGQKVEKLQEKIAEQTIPEADSSIDEAPSLRDSRDTDPGYGQFSFSPGGADKEEMIETPKPVAQVKPKPWDSPESPPSLADHTAEASNGSSPLQHGSQGQFQAAEERQEQHSRRPQVEQQQQLPEQEPQEKQWSNAELELMVAAGKYDTQRFKDYQQELDYVMDSRMQHGMEEGCLPQGYESDLDREEAEERERELEEEMALEEELQRYPERRNFFSQEGVIDSPTTNWVGDNEWMDEYRKNKDDSFTYVFDEDAGDYALEEEPPVLPRHSQAAPPQAARAEESNLGGGAYDAYQQPPQRNPRGRQVLSMDDLAMLNSNFIPFVQDEFPVYGIEERLEGSLPVDGQQQGKLSPVFSPFDGPVYYSDGDMGTRVYWPLVKQKSKVKNRRYTTPQPFKFEHHKALPERPIVAAKLESELIIKRQEEERARRTPFVAKPLPAATLEPRYVELSAEQELVRESNRHTSHQWHKAIEAPFSFYYTDKLREEAKEEQRRRLTDPNRFQSSFKAKSPPSHIYEERFRDLQAEEEKKKHSRVLRAEMLVGGAALPSRMAQAEIDRDLGLDDERRRRRQAKLAAVDPEWQAKYRRRPLGYTPDFDQLHADFEFEACKTRARVRRGVTVPEEFNLSGTNRKENAARRMRVLEGKEKHIVDILIDQEELPEYRWPYITPRGRVPPSVPPGSYVDRGYTARDPTVLSAKRAVEVKKDRKQMEAKAETARKEKELRERLRAQINEKMKSRTSHETSYTSARDISRISEMHEATEINETQESVNVTARSSGGNVVPSQYQQARHKQAEAHAREQFQEALLAQGIDALRFVEEDDRP